jgi:hypothetical protein
MTDKTDFTEEEWDAVLSGPPSAGLMVAGASRGGTFRESYSIAKSYAEARKEHGASAVLDEIVSSKPKTDRTHYHSFDELRDGSVKRIQAGLDTLASKADAEEVGQYKQFIASLAKKVAEAHKEDGKEISEGEQAALDTINQTLGL